MSTILKGIYRHTTSGRLYNVIGVGRSVENPSRQVVIYEQLYDSHLKAQLKDQPKGRSKDEGVNLSDTPLPKGSLWTRDYDDFNADIDGGVKRFTLVDDPSGRGEPEGFKR